MLNVAAAPSRHEFARAINPLISDNHLQIVRTMKLLEVTSIEELEPKHVTQLQRLVPRG